MMKNFAKNRGFTLIEIVLYMVIVTIILFAIMSFSIQIFGTNSHAVSVQEIETNIDFISNKISATVKNASSIDVANCIFDNDLGKLSLNVPAPQKSPTIFYLQNGVIYIKEVSGSIMKMNSDYTQCPQLRFSRVTQIKTPDLIVMDMRCEPISVETMPVIPNLHIHTSMSLRR